MIIFDYIFYRVAKFFYRKDGIDATRAIGTLTFIQGSILTGLLVSVLRSVYGFSEVSTYSKMSSRVGVCLFIVIAIINYTRYKGKYWQLAEKWKNKETVYQYKLRGLLIIVAIIMPFILFFWMGTSGYRQ